LTLQDGETFAYQQIDDHPTRATARLPWIGDRFVHRKSPAADAEQISINMKPVPSFDAFGRFLQTANPFAFWAQMAWFPWLGAASVMSPLSVEPPKLSQKNTEPGM
jgi:hypothetical protein